MATPTLSGEINNLFNKITLKKSDNFLRSPGVQTGFGFSQGQNGQTQATAQLGGNIQAPQLGGLNFNRPGNIGGFQPTFLNRPVFGNGGFFG